MRLKKEGENVEVVGVIWLELFVEKLQRKHNVRTDEVEEVLYRKPKVRKVANGNVAGEDVYSAMGQTAGGRYLLVISARDMRPKERRQYAKK